MENHVFQAEKALPPGKDMHEMPRGCLYKGGPETQALPSPSGSQPHHGLSGTNFYAKCVPD